MFCKSLLSCWPLYCLSFDLSILITPLVSSTFSYYVLQTKKKPTKTQKTSRCRLIGRFLKSYLLCSFYTSFFSKTRNSTIPSAFIFTDKMWFLLLGSHEFLKTCCCLMKKKIKKILKLIFFLIQIVLFRINLKMTQIFINYKFLTPNR